MRKFNRRGVLGLGALAGASLALEGCGGDSGSSSPGTTATVAAKPDSAKGEIVYWDHFTGADERKGFESVTSAFRKAYSGIDLKVTSAPNTDFMTKFTTAVQSGNPPDSTMVSMVNSGDMIGMNGLRDIGAAMANWSGYEDIDPKLVAPFQKDGKTYGVPCLLFVDWFYYRTDWLKEAGVAKPPSTWSEFRSVAKKLTDPKKGRYGFGLRGGAGGGTEMVKFIAGYNGPLTDGSGKPSMEEGAVATALKQYTDTYLVDKSVPQSAPADGYNQIFQAFFNGETGLLMHHTGSLNSVSDALKPGKQVMTAVMPRAKYTIGTTEPLANGVSSDQEQENSLAWIEFWGSADPQLKFLDATGYFPATKKAQQSATITSNPMFKAALQQVKEGKTPVYFPGFNDWTQNTVLVQMQAVMVGKQSVDKAAKTITEKFKALF